MPKKKIIGRPPLPINEVRNRVLICRLLGSELAQIESAAKKAKKSKSQFIRDAALSAAQSTIEERKSPRI